MNEIVKNMAGVVVPKDVLDQVDMASLLKDLAKDYQSLDDITRARQKHENRNFLSRWLNKGELEKAQLDAVQLQARYAKSLGQLMVISIAQSKALEAQQEQMGQQQSKIKQQAAEIQAANDTIREQQDLLATQQANLEKLIKDYFLLKGLTINEAKRLIAIANEVKQTKDELLSRLEDVTTRCDGISNDNERISREIQELSGTITRSVEALDAERGALRENIAAHERRMGSLEERVDASLAAMAGTMTADGEKLRHELQVSLDRHLGYIKMLSAGFVASLALLLIFIGKAL